MRTYSARVMVALAAVGIVGLAAACGKSPDQPEPVSIPPAPVAPVAPVVITAIRISGPATIAPGATGQFTATAERSDGSSEDVTTSTWWRTAYSTRETLRWIGAGMAQAGGRGEAHVEAHVGPDLAGVTSNQLTVFVLEPGTFRISGTVTDAGAPVEQAIVEIMSGTGSGLWTTANDRGQYALYGAAGEVELQVSAVGFEQQAHRIVVTDTTTNDFDLTPRVTPTDLSGPWILTLSMSPSCRARLQAVPDGRQFDAAITQQGTRFKIALSSPTIYRDPYWFDGRIFGQTLSIYIGTDTSGVDFEYPGLYDSVSPTLWFGIFGSVQGTVTGSEFRATLDGQLSSDVSLSPPFGKPQVICSTKDSAVVFRRR